MEWGFCNYVGYNFGTENFYLCKMNGNLNLPTPSAFATAFAVLKYWHAMQSLTRSAVN